MQSEKHIVIFSHGFGVRRDSRGLFSDIVSALDGTQPVLFDYNEIDEAANELTVWLLSEQAEILKNKVNEVRVLHPDAIIDIVCHSQGAIAPALAQLQGIHKIILIAPPVTMNFERMLEAFKARPGTVIDMEGISRITRRDGSVTLIPSQYWVERAEIRPMELYDALAKNTELVVIKARQDEVLGETDFSGLDDARIIELDGDHNFTGENRMKLLKVLAQEIV